MLYALLTGTLVNVCVVYYSKTGKTRKLVEYIKERLKESGINVNVFLVKPIREYFDKFLHLNPRILYETLMRKPVELINSDIKLENCDALVISTPVWWGAASPPIYSFITKHSGKYSNPIYCVTTADLNVDYASKLRRELEDLKYNVVDCLSVVDPDKDRDKLDKLVKEITEKLQQRS